MSGNDDLTEALAPKSDQLNADDLRGGPIVLTIVGVKQVEREGKRTEVRTREAKPWYPSKGWARVLAELWGTKGSAWVGKRVQVYRDPDVVFGGQVVGGIAVSHVSGLDGPYATNMTIARAKKKAVTVQPLATPGLDAVMAELGVTVEQYDRWATAAGKPTFDQLTEVERPRVATWLLGRGAELVRA
jgi:hypothetical protein